MIYLVTKQQSLWNCENYSIISPTEALNILNSWDIIQYDSETSGRDPHICKILCIQFGNKNADIQIVVDITTVNILLFKDILESKLLVGQNIKFDLQFLYNHNIKPLKVYDTMIIEQFLHLGYDNKFFHYSLKAICERRLHIDIDKTTRGEIIWRGLDSKVILYAAGDVMYLEDIMEQQIKECRDRNAINGMNIENNFVPVIAYLEWCGIHLDVNKWNLKLKDNQTKLQNSLNALNAWVVDEYKKGRFNNSNLNQYEYFEVRLENHGDITVNKIPKGYRKVGEVIREVDDFGRIHYIQKLTNDVPFISVNTQGDLFSGFDLEPKCNINWASAKQVIPFVQLLGFTTKIQDKNTGENKDSIVEKVLAKQKGIADDFLKLYFAYKEQFKECSTYGQNYLDAINPVTNRIHTNFKQLGAASGRMSCGSKSKNEDLARFKKISASRCSYVQLQNLPADDITRSAFTAQEGNLFCSCDYSALESRLGADIYNEPEMLKEFLEGSGDMHSLCAKLVFHKELEGIAVKDIATVRPDLRKKVKPIEFSQQFGGGAKAVADALGCSKKEAQEFVDAYANGFKGIAEFKKKGSLFVRNNGYIIICKLTGHRLIWEDWNKWKAIEDDQYYEQKLSKSEIDEHRMAAAKWDRLALNVVTQGTGIIILKYAMTLFYKWLIQNNLFNKVLLCDLVHDEACIEFPEDRLDIPEKLKYFMEFAASKICKKLPIPAKPEVGKFWIH